MSKSEIFSRETFTVVALSQREPTAVIGFCNFMVFDGQATLHKVLVKSSDRKKGIGTALNYLGIQICRAEAIKINVLATSFYWELILPKTGIRTIQTMGIPTTILILNLYRFLHDKKVVIAENTRRQELIEQIVSPSEHRQENYVTLQANGSCCSVM